MASFSILCLLNAPWPLSCANSHRPVNINPWQKPYTDHDKMLMAGVSMYDIRVATAAKANTAARSRVTKPRDFAVFDLKQCFGMALWTSCIVYLGRHAAGEMSCLSCLSCCPTAGLSVGNMAQLFGRGCGGRNGRRVLKIYIQTRRGGGESSNLADFRPQVRTAGARHCPYRHLLVLNAPSTVTIPG